ncbi:MAG: nucleoside monophosphate kinase [Lentisphaerae bacterium]|nr:nucleoside monophosphate kinase [Lentisphaerota bacterium]
MAVRAMVLLGAPGAGKGTMAEVVKAAMPVTHIATGDMLRDEIRAASALGQEADGYMRQGRLVPDDLIVRMVMRRVDQGAPDARYMFDGFPRTRPQADLLDRHFQERGAQLALVVLLEVTRDICLDRLTGRRVCRKCGANFHVRNIPPLVAGVCDQCGGELYQRPDDMPETIERRLEVFKEQTAGLIDYYSDKGLLVRVDSSRHRDETVPDLMQAIADRHF